MVLFFAFLACICLLNSPLGRATVFGNFTPITINDNAAATPYPSVITVSGLNGSVTRVRVTLTGFSHEYPEDVDVLLVGPQGQKVMLMSDAGDNGVTGSAVSDLTLVFDDSAANPPAEFAKLESGTYKPSDYEGFGDDIFPANAPAGPYSPTLAAFNSSNPNGVWNLYIRDDFQDAAGSVSGGWMLDITTSGGTFSNLSVSQQSPAQVLANANLFYNLTVTNSGPDTAPTAFFTDTIPANTVFQSLSIPSGWTCQTPAPGASGTITCNKSGLASNSSANFSVGVTVKAATPPETLITNQPSVSASNNDPDLSNNSSRLDSVVVSNQTFTASAAIAIPDNTIAASYPATLTVGGLSGNIIGLKVRLLRLSHAFPEDLDILLVGPQGQKVLLMSDAGDNGLTNSSVSNLVLVFDDSAATLPATQRLTSGVYKPSNYTGVGNDMFPGPAPAGPYSATLSAFSGTNPNGVWSLYIRDDSTGGSGQLALGWSLDIFSSDCATPFVVTLATDTGSCGTLSKAITEANRASGSVTISFSNISSLNLTNPLPLISNVNGQPVTVDGTCQFQLNGRGQPGLTMQPATGVVINSGLQLGNNVVVKGLAFYGFSGFAVDIFGANNRLSCNWLGRPDSQTGTPNGGGLRLAVGSANTTLGESGQTFSGNLIAGNNGVGWQLNSTTGNKSYYTWLGLDKNGNALPNAVPGLTLAPGAVILFLQGNRLKVS